MNKDYEYYKHKRVNSLQEILELSIKNGKDDIAFFYNGKDENIIYKTYYEFYNDVTSLKKYFYKKFKNKHICIIGNNSYDWLVIYLGIVLSGNVAVIIDKDLKNKEVLNYIDVLVDGQYKDELHNPKLRWCGSSNQRVIDVKKTISENKIVLYEENLIGV